MSTMPDEVVAGGGSPFGGGPSRRGGARVLEAAFLREPRRHHQVIFWCAVAWISAVVFAALFANLLPLARYDVIIPGLKPSMAPHLGFPEPLGTDVPPLPPAKVNRVLGEPGKGFPNTADFYPSASIRLDEMGVVVVRGCVDSTGRLTSDPTLVQSSGKPRLDDAALKLARAGSGHYRATTEDGKPVSSCYAFGIRFDLRN